MATSDRTCPSATCTPGNQLLGVKGADGYVRHLRTALTIDADFVETASELGKPEARMRFASTCATSGCAQWTGTRCGVIDHVIEHLEQVKVPLAPSIPPCPIRGSCRWYDQTGETACRACSLVVTDQSAIAAE
ncbi:hypothetical protein ACFORG_07815 [Lutimaribacter marinistellae]|uniref:Uncharacterized protein n=1 Tax=Lutimaribacter marinistellae TaxID=1820329 RepID=A0ABV7TEJ6_9RHOB